MREEVTEMLKNELLKLKKQAKSKYTLSQTTKIPKNFIPVCCAFMELIEHPLLEGTMEKALRRMRRASQTRKPFEEIKAMRKEALKEVRLTRSLLEPYAPFSLAITKMLRQCSDAEKSLEPDSFDLLGALYQYLCDAIHTLLMREDCDDCLNAILKNMVHSPENDFGIIYTFSPSMIALEKEYETCNDEKVDDLWDALHSLERLLKCYNLRNKRDDTLNILRRYKRSALAYHSKMNAEKIDLLMKLDTSGEAARLGFDVEEYQVKQSLIWEVFEAELDILIEAATNSQKRESKIVTLKKHRKTIIVKCGNKEASFSTSCRPGRYLEEFYKNPNDSIQIKQLWKQINSNQVVEPLDSTEMAQFNEAHKTVCKRLKKIGISEAFKKSDKTSEELESDRKIFPNPKYKFVKESK
jgi:hypothetical protein